MVRNPHEETRAPAPRTTPRPSPVNPHQATRPTTPSRPAPTRTVTNPHEATRPTTPSSTSTSNRSGNSRGSRSDRARDRTRPASSPPTTPTQPSRPTPPKPLREAVPAMSSPGPNLGPGETYDPNFDYRSQLPMHDPTNDYGGTLIPNRLDGGSVGRDVDPNTGQPRTVHVGRDGRVSYSDAFRYDEHKQNYDTWDTYYDWETDSMRRANNVDQTGPRADYSNIPMEGSGGGGVQRSPMFGGPQGGPGIDAGSGGGRPGGPSTGAGRGAPDRNQLTAFHSAARECTCSCCFAKNVRYVLWR